MNKLKLAYQEIKSRLTGFSIPVFGISWQPDEAEIKIAQRVITQLEDRRVLYSPYEMETYGCCVSSIFEIRRMLTDELGKIKQSSQLYNDLQILRAACRKFLDRTQPFENELKKNFDYIRASNRINNTLYMNTDLLRDLTNGNWIFMSALGELRGVFGIGIAKIAVSYGINITGDLIEIIPIENND